MEDISRIGIIVVIVYGIVKGIYRSIRYRSSDNSLWAIIILLGIDIWLSRMFLIVNPLYDFISISAILLAVSSFILSNRTDISLWIKRSTICLLCLSLLWFVSLNIISYNKNSNIIETPLRGYSINRIDLIYFKFQDRSFSRNLNLTDYAIGKQIGDYNVILTVKPISENIVRLESVDLLYKKRKSIDNDDDLGVMRVE